MRRVRAGVADKLDRGVYTPADLEELRRIERDLCAPADCDSDAADDLARLRAASDPLGPHTFTSHRAVSGRFIVAGKQWLRRLVTPVAAVTFARQTEFNGAVVRLIATLERRDRELRARCDELQAEVRTLRARLDRDRPAGKPE
jgi:hypothetical protein